MITHASLIPMQTHSFICTSRHIKLPMYTLYSSIHLEPNWHCKEVWITSELVSKFPQFAGKEKRKKWRPFASKQQTKIGHIQFLTRRERMRKMRMRRMKASFWNVFDELACSSVWGHCSHGKGKMNEEQKVFELMEIVLESFLSILFIYFFF